MSLAKVIYLKFSQKLIRNINVSAKMWPSSVHKFISEHPEILITRADKGNISVILDLNEYKTKKFCLMIIYTQSVIKIL